MKKIAILSYYFGTENRGVESWAQELKKHLVNGFQVQIFSGNQVYNLVDYLKSDIIVSTGGRFEVLFCRLTTWLARKSLIVFGHSGPGADDKWNLLCSPDVFVAFSHYQANWAKKHKLPWTKVEVIPHAVDVEKFKPSTKKSQKNIILCVAARHPDKRIELVEQAVKTLPECELIVVGKGNKLQVPFEKMPEVYRLANVFCFVPQPWEAFGIVFLEAMATNLPVVTTNDAIRREIVGDAGIFVKDPENIQELSDAIKKILITNWNNKPRIQAKKFSWEQISLQYYKVLNSL